MRISRLAGSWYERDGERQKTYGAITRSDGVARLSLSPRWPAAPVRRRQRVRIAAPADVPPVRPALSISLPTAGASRAHGPASPYPHWRTLSPRVLDIPQRRTAGGKARSPSMRFTRQRGSSAAPRLPARSAPPRDPAQGPSPKAVDRPKDGTPWRSLGSGWLSREGLWRLTFACFRFRPFSAPGAG